MKKRKYPKSIVRVKVKKTLQNKPVALEIRMLKPKEHFNVMPFGLSAFFSKLKSRKFFTSAQSHFHSIKVTQVARKHNFLRLLPKNTVVFTLSVFLLSIGIFFQKPTLQSQEIKDVSIKQTSITMAGRPTTYTVLVKKSSVTGKHRLVKLPKGAKNITIESISQEEADDILFSNPNETAQLSLEKKYQLAAAIKKTPPSSFAKASADKQATEDRSSKTYNIFSGLKNFLLATIWQVSAQTDDSATPSEPELPSSEQSVEQTPVEPAESPTKTESPEQVQEEQSESTDIIVIQAPDAVFVDVSSEIQDDTEVADEAEELLEIQENQPQPSETAGATGSQQDQEDTLEIPVIAPDLENQETEPEDVVEIPEELIEVIKITYETEAPTITEKETAKGKLVTVSAPNEDPENPIKDVLASTTIPEIFKVGQENKIKIKWKTPSAEDLADEKWQGQKDENNQINIAFNVYDTNGNGYLDYVEWTVPHLSEQDFDIIYVAEALHLDEQKEILKDITDQVHDHDQVYQTIKAGQYVRATFDTILNNKRDITLYARPTNENQLIIIEVYPIDQNGNVSADPIATFDPIDHDGKYRILLTDLETPTDLFDLKIVNAVGSGDGLGAPSPSQAGVDIDQIVDPAFACEANGTTDFSWTNTARWDNCNK